MDENNTIQGERRKRLRHYLAAYGADATRWPAQAGHLLLRDARADGDRSGLEFGEAREVDRLLDAAPSPPVPAGAARQALASILASGAVPASPPNVVAVDFSGRGADVRRSAWGGPIAGLAALAAALILGVYVGAAGLVEGVIPSDVASVGSGATDFDIVEHVLAELEEDLG
jgi:hypothetical protein